MLRLIRPAALALVCALAVAACGDDTTEPEGAGSAASTPVNAESSTSSPAAPAYPVTIEHAMGSTTIEERPERIVTLNVQWTDAVLAMGEQPAAYMLDTASLETDPYPWHVDAVSGSARIDAAGTIPYEAIAEQQPDLILVTYLGEDPEVFSTLSDIAPTIGLLGDLQVDAWQEQVRVIGEVLGDPERADAVVAEVEGHVAALAEELPGLAGHTYVTANYVKGDGIYVVADPEDGASRLFYGLGMEIDPDILALDEEAVGRVHLSVEQVGLLDADLLLTLTNGADPNELPGWSALSAVEAGTMLDFTFADVVGLNTPTPLSLPYELTLLRPSLEKLAAG